VVGVDQEPAMIEVAPLSGRAGGSRGNLH
jgi:hypothetical protein